MAPPPPPSMYPTPEEEQPGPSLLFALSARSSSASPLLRKLARPPDAPLQGPKSRRLTPPASMASESLAAREHSTWTPGKLALSASRQLLPRSPVSTFATPEPSPVLLPAANLPPGKTRSIHRVDTEAKAHLEKSRGGSVGDVQKSAGSAQELSRTDPSGGGSAKEQENSEDRTSHIPEPADSKSKPLGTHEVVKRNHLALQALPTASVGVSKAENFKKVVNNVSGGGRKQPPEENSQAGKRSRFQSAGRESLVPPGARPEGAAAYIGQAAGKSEPLQTSEVGLLPHTNRSSPRARSPQEDAAAHDRNESGTVSGLGKSRARQTEGRSGEKADDAAFSKPRLVGQDVSSPAKSAARSAARAKASESTLSGADRQGVAPEEEVMAGTSLSRTAPAMGIGPKTCPLGSGGKSSQLLSAPGEGSSDYRRRASYSFLMQGGSRSEEQGASTDKKTRTVCSGPSYQVSLPRDHEFVAGEDWESSAAALSEFSEKLQYLLKTGAMAERERATSSQGRQKALTVTRGSSAFASDQNTSILNGSESRPATLNEVSSPGDQLLSASCQRDTPSKDAAATDFEVCVKALLPPALSDLQSDTVYVCWGLPGVESKGVKGICVEQSFSPRHEYILLDIPLSVIAPSLFRVAAGNGDAGANATSQSCHFSTVSLPSFLETTDGYSARDPGSAPPPPLPGSLGGKESVSSCSFFPSPEPLAGASTRKSSSLLSTSARPQEPQHLRTPAGAPHPPGHAPCNSSGTAPSSARHLSSPPGVFFSLLPSQSYLPQIGFNSLSSSSQLGYPGSTGDSFLYNAKTGTAFPPPPSRPHMGKTEQQVLFTQQTEHVPHPGPTPQTPFTAPGPQRILQLSHHHPRTHSVPPLLHPDQPAQLSNRHLAPPPPQPSQMHRQLSSPGLSHWSIPEGFSPEPRPQRATMATTPGANAAAIRDSTPLQQPQLGPTGVSMQAPCGSLGRAAWWGFNAPAVALEETLSCAFLRNNWPAGTVQESFRKNAACQSTPLLASPVPERHLAPGGCEPAGSVDKAARTSGARTLPNTFTPPLAVSGAPMPTRSLPRIPSSRNYAGEHGSPLPVAPVPRGPSLLFPRIDIAAAERDTVPGFCDPRTVAAPRTATAPAMVGASAPAVKSTRLAGLALSGEQPFIGRRTPADTAVAAATAGLLLECAPLLRCIDCASRTLVFVDTHSLKAQTKPPAAFAVQQALVAALLRQALQTFMAEYQNELQFRIQKKIRKKRRGQGEREAKLLAQRATNGNTKGESQGGAAQEMEAGGCLDPANNRKSGPPFLHESSECDREEVSYFARGGSARVHQSEENSFSSLDLDTRGIAADTKTSRGSVQPETTDTPSECLAGSSSSPRQKCVLESTATADQQSSASEIGRTGSRAAKAPGSMGDAGAKTAKLADRLSSPFENPARGCPTNDKAIVEPRDVRPRQVAEEQGVTATSLLVASPNQRTVQYMKSREVAARRDSRTTESAASAVLLARKLPSSERPNCPEQSWGACAHLGDLRHGKALSEGLSEVRLLSLLRAESYRGEILRRQLQQEQRLLLVQQKSPSDSSGDVSYLRSRLRRHTYHGSQVEALGRRLSVLDAEKGFCEASTVAAGVPFTEALSRSADVLPHSSGTQADRSILELWRSAEEPSLRALLYRMYKEQTAAQAQIEYQQHRLQQWREAAELQVREQQVEEAMQAFSLTRREATDLLQHTDEGLALYDVFCSQAAALRAGTPRGKVRAHDSELEAARRRRCQSAPPSGSPFEAACFPGLTKDTGLRCGTAEAAERGTSPEPRQACAHASVRRPHAAADRGPQRHSSRVLTMREEREAAAEGFEGQADNTRVLAQEEAPSPGLDGEELWLENWRKRWDRHWACVAPPLVLRFSGTAAAKRRGRGEGHGKIRERVSETREKASQAAVATEQLGKLRGRASTASSATCIGSTGHEPRTGAETHSLPSEETYRHSDTAQTGRPAALFPAEKDRTSPREWMEDKQDSTPRLWWLVPKGALCAHCGRSQREMALSCMGDVAHLSLAIRVGARTRAEAAEAARPSTCTSAGTESGQGSHLGVASAHLVTGTPERKPTQLSESTVGASVSDVLLIQASAAQDKTRVQGDAENRARFAAAKRDERRPLNSASVSCLENGVNPDLKVPERDLSPEAGRVVGGIDAASNSGPDQASSFAYQKIASGSVSYSQPNRPVSSPRSGDAQGTCHQRCSSAFGRSTAAPEGDYKSSQPHGVCFGDPWLQSTGYDAVTLGGRGNGSGASAQQQVLDRVCGHPNVPFSESVRPCIAPETRPLYEPDTVVVDVENLSGNALLGSPPCTNGSYCGCHLSPEDAVADAASLGGASLSSPSSRSSRDSSAPGSPTGDVSKKLHEAGGNSDAAHVRSESKRRTHRKMGELQENSHTVPASSRAELPVRVCVPPLPAGLDRLEGQPSTDPRRHTRTDPQHRLQEEDRAKVSTRSSDEAFVFGGASVTEQRVSLLAAGRMARHLELLNEDTFALFAHIVMRLPPRVLEACAPPFFQFLFKLRDCWARQLLLLPPKGQYSLGLSQFQHQLQQELQKEQVYRETVLQPIISQRLRQLLALALKNYHTYRKRKRRGTVREALNEAPCPP